MGRPLVIFHTSVFLRVLRAFAVVLLFEGNYAFSVQLNIQCMPYLSVSDPNKSPQNIC
jgi:hypothetical protein